MSEGKVVSIRGHEADVFSAGYICPKGVALKDLHEDPDRLRRPLIKRDGEFVEASWDEAFTEIERRLHDRGVLVAPVRSPVEAIEAPQVAAPRDTDPQATHPIDTAVDTSRATNSPPRR